MTILFDFDGVLMDTETLYTKFWDTTALRYVGRKNFGASVKGQTLKHIFDAHFPDPKVQAEIETLLDQYEHDMPYAYIPGAEELLKALKEAGVKTAVVTSSNVKKMENVYRSHPEFQSYFDAILTSEQFEHSKPHPDCFLKGMRQLGAKPEETVVFEDSFFGLQAAHASKAALVVALATTNPRTALEGKADIIVDDLSSVSVGMLQEALAKS